jgi:uncharacterized membrane protein
MALDVTAQVRIERPTDEVAAYEFEPRNDPHWIGGVKTVEVKTAAPFAKGSQVLRKGSFMGRPIQWLMEVVEFEPGRRVAMHALRSPFPMDVTYDLEPSDGATTATIRIQGEARGFYGMLGPLTPGMVKRSVMGDLRRLKKRVEDGAQGG